MIKFDLQLFGGRGASSASGGGGGAGGAGGAGGGASAQNQQPAQDDNAQADTTQVAQAMGASYQAFMGMSDDDKADYIDSVVGKQVPVFLADNAFQRFTYNSQMNDKPQIVTDSALDAMNGTELYRTVNATYNSKADIGFRADEIAAQVTKGSVTRVSDTGGSVYGRGIYFADDYRGSTAYGNAYGDVKRSAVVRCKLNSNAKTISYTKASSGLQSEMGSGSKLGKSLQKVYRTDRQSAISMYALSKGYNVLTSGHGYFNVLNRNAVTMSDTIKAVSRNGKW